MGSSDNVTQMWALRETAGINPGFVRSVVAIQMEKLRQGLEISLMEPGQQAPVNQEYIRGLLSAVPEVRTLMIHAMELAVLGRLADDTRSLHAPADRYTLPPNSRELEIRIKKARPAVQEQLGLMALPEVSDDLRGSIRATFCEQIFDAIAEQVSISAFENLGFGKSRGGVSPG